MLLRGVNLKQNLLPPSGRRFNSTNYSLPSLRSVIPTKPAVHTPSRERTSGEERSRPNSTLHTGAIVPKGFKLMSCSRARLFLLRASPKKHSESRNRVKVPESVLYRPESRSQFVKYELNKGAPRPGRKRFNATFAQRGPVGGLSAERKMSKHARCSSVKDVVVGPSILYKNRRRAFL